MARTAQPKVTNITKVLAHGHQDLNLKIVDMVKVGPKTAKLKFEIKSDSYDFQSYARAYVWDEMNMVWNTVHTIHHSAMKTPAGLAYMPGVAQGKKDQYEFKFDADLAELRRVVYAIVF